ncbi:IQ domain-containing protein IQM6-like isoform X2 [Lycium barbarum]|uniref:IQ domain-containing protein IQM6-like isoform X2 n=1 Tax=Lycium barbarum TaxID=112863 RepID=UPI00293E24B2|nr:IQ domain-containing protein IQM6-like isoform X2 [Lycium barbarum]
MEANQKPNSVGALLIPTIMQTPMPDSTVLLEDLLWRALDFATLRQSSVSFFDIAKTESVVSRWKRAKIWASKIDPRHRYGVNLNRYHEVWCNSESSQPFFYWLDFGDGKEAIAEKCSRSDLQSQCIKYLGPKEREAYEVTLKNGKFMYTKTGVYVDTVEGTKWMFVLSTSRTLYAGEKQRHHFHHSSFLAGGASLSSGRLVVSKGELEAIWAYSGHYRPTEEHFEEIITFLEEHHVDLTNVKKYAIDDDTVPKSKVSSLTNESKDDGTKNSTNEVIPHAA